MFQTSLGDFTNAIILLFFNEMVLFIFVIILGLLKNFVLIIQMLSYYCEFFFFSGVRRQ